MVERDRRGEGAREERKERGSEQRIFADLSLELGGYVLEVGHDGLIAISLAREESQQMGLEITTKDLGSRLQVRETGITCEKSTSGGSIQENTRVYKSIQEYTRVYKNTQRVCKASYLV